MNLKGIRRWGSGHNAGAMTGCVVIQKPARTDLGGPLQKLFSDEETREPATSHDKGRVFWSEAITLNATTRSVVVVEFGGVNTWSIPAVEKMTSCWRKKVLWKKDLESIEESLFWMALRKLGFDTSWSTSFRWWFWGLVGKNDFRPFLN